MLCLCFGLHHEKFLFKSSIPGCSLMSSKFRKQPELLLDYCKPLYSCLARRWFIAHTLSVLKFAQYYFSRTPRCANLSTARIIVRAKRSDFSNLKILYPSTKQHDKSLIKNRLYGQSNRKNPYWKDTRNIVTSETQKQLQSEKQTGNIKIDSRLTFSNLLHAEWITSFYDVIRNNRQML